MLDCSKYWLVGRSAPPYCETVNQQSTVETLRGVSAFKASEDRPCHHGSPKYSLRASVTSAKE